MRRTSDLVDPSQEMCEDCGSAPPDVDGELIMVGMEGRNIIKAWVCYECQAVRRRNR